MMTEYRVVVRDNTSLQYVAELDDYQSLNLIPTFNGVGTWQLVTDYSVGLAKDLATFSAGIVVFRDGQEVLSGPISNPDRNWSSQGDVLTLTGVDDNVCLSRRLALPTPGGTNYGSSFDVRSGPAETIMKQYVNYNAGPLALSQRQVPGLTIEADQARGASISGSARFDNLLTLLQNLALAGGDLGFKVVQVGNGLQFQVYLPTDCTETAIFSPMLGNLIGFGYSQTAPVANYIIAGNGSTTSTSLMFSEAGDSDSIDTYGRIETYYDDSGVTNSTQLAQDVQTQLSQNAQQSSMTLTALDTGAVQYLRDYSLGDTVSVVVPLKDGGVDVIQDVVRSINLTLTNNNGEQISPTIGTPQTLAAGVPRIFSKMSALETRISRVERRR